MALPVSGKNYRFKCVGASTRYLNLYSSGTASDGMNVVLWTSDSSNEQKWQYDGSKLRPLTNTTFALDKYTVAGNANNNNADIWTANDPVNQNLTFVAVSGNTVKIKLASSSLYLTAYSNANGTGTGKTPTSAGNVYWASSSTSTLQQWTFEEVTGGGTSTGEVVVTGMPNIPSIYGTSLTEYFHPTSGMSAGTFYGTNNGQTAILNKISAFYNKAFKIAPSGIEKYAYSLFGSKTIAAGTEFHNTYHHGVDMYYYDGAPVYTAHAGELIFADYNRVAIYDATKNVTYFYLHTLISNSFSKLLNQHVPVGTQIGTQSNQGLGTNGASHLHFEVKSGRTTAVAMPSTSLTTPLPSLNPYNYM